MEYGTRRLTFRNVPRSACSIFRIQGVVGLIHPDADTPFTHSQPEPTPEPKPGLLRPPTPNQFGLAEASCIFTRPPIRTAVFGGHQ